MTLEYNGWLPNNTHKCNHFYLLNTKTLVNEVFSLNKCRLRFRPACKTGLLLKYTMTLEYNGWLPNNTHKYNHFYLLNKKTLVNEAFSLNKCRLRFQPACKTGLLHKYTMTFEYNSVLPNSTHKLNHSYLLNKKTLVNAVFWLSKCRFRFWPACKTGLLNKYKMTFQYNGLLPNSRYT